MNFEFIKTASGCIKPHLFIIVVCGARNRVFELGKVNRSWLTVLSRCRQRFLFILAGLSRLWWRWRWSFGCPFFGSGLRGFLFPPKDILSDSFSQSLLGTWCKGVARSRACRGHFERLVWI